MIKLKRLICLYLTILICCLAGNVSASAPSPQVHLGKLEITKVVTFDEKETYKTEAQGYTFKFMIFGENNYRKNVSIKVTMGHNQTLIKGLEPGKYTIIEYDTDRHFSTAAPIAVDVEYNKTTKIRFENEYLEQKRPDHWWMIEDLMAALGLVFPFNQVGDCFD